MTTRPLTTEQLDDGWCLDEAPLHDDVPSSAFEQAFWEQVEGRALKRRFGDGVETFGAKRAA